MNEYIVQWKTMNKFGLCHYNLNLPPFFSICLYKIETQEGIIFHSIHMCDSICINILLICILGILLIANEGASSI